VHAADGRPRDEEEVSQVRIVLIGEGIEHFSEPRTGLVHDHRHDDGRSLTVPHGQLLGVGHDGESLPMP
jgi:hypothetical protein